MRKKFTPSFYVGIVFCVSIIVSRLIASDNDINYFTISSKSSLVQEIHQYYQEINTTSHTPVSAIQKLRISHKLSQLGEEALKKIQHKSMDPHDALMAVWMLSHIPSYRQQVSFRLGVCSINLMQAWLDQTTHLNHFQTYNDVEFVLSLRIFSRAMSNPQPYRSDIYQTWLYKWVFYTKNISWNDCSIPALQIVRAHLMNLPFSRDFYYGPTDNYLTPNFSLNNHQLLMNWSINWCKAFNQLNAGDLADPQYIKYLLVPTLSKDLDPDLYNRVLTIKTNIKDKYIDFPIIVSIVVSPCYTQYR